MCMCGRREVTRKTLAETRTARKKNPTPNLQVYFLLKAFLRKALHCAGEGVTTKVPLGQLPTLPYLYIIRSQHVQHNNLHRICGGGGGGGSFFKRDACMHNTSHHAVTCLKSLQDFQQVHVSHLHSAFEAAVERSRSVFERLVGILRAE